MGTFMAIHGSVITLLVCVVVVAGWLMDKIAERDIVMRAADAIEREGICCTRGDE